MNMILCTSDLARERKYNFRNRGSDMWDRNKKLISDKIMCIYLLKLK